MISTVALIMGMESSTLFRGLARCMPVWIADLPANNALRDVASQMRNEVDVTWFPLVPNETLEQAALRISFSLDDHYDELAQSEGYKTLIVFGASETAAVGGLASLGFKTVERTPFGYVASKE